MNVQIRTRKNKDGLIRYSAILEVWNQGVRTPVSAGTYATESEAVAAGARELLKYETDLTKTAAIKSQMSLSAWAAEWTGRREGTVKESTQSHNTWRLDHWILPYLGHLKLIDISSVHIRDWIDEDLAYLGSQSKKLAIDTLKVCLQGAVERRALTVNPAKGMGVNLSKALKKQEKQAKPIKAWSHDEGAVLLSSSSGTSIDALVVMGLLCGLRPGETHGLLWSDIDWLNETVTIRRSRIQLPEGMVITDSPKSGLNRTIKIPFEAIKRMMVIREQSVTDEVLPIHPSTARTVLQRLCKRLQIAELTPHSLRHTFASLALSAGAPVAAVSEILGHSDAHITMTVYAHALPKDVLETTKMVERALMPRADVAATKTTGVPETILHSTGREGPENGLGPDKTAGHPT